jgi:chaperonin GroEL (HSP60 family)
VLSNDNINYGYNAARDRYEDLMKAGIMDPSKVPSIEWFYQMMHISLA